MVAWQVGKDRSTPQDRTLVQVDTPNGLWVLEVALVGPQGENVKVDLEGCRVVLADHTSTPADSKVGPVKVVLVGHTDNQTGSRVGLEGKVLAG